MSESAFGGTVRGGKVIFDQSLAWTGTLARHEGKRVTVTVRKLSVRRSSNQNRWYWSCVVPFVAECLSVGRALPLSRDQAHYVLKSAFLGTEDTPLGPIPKSTAGLSIEEFSAYCERIVAHAATEWGVALPQPGERIEASL
jgi:hypothetical protein